MRQNAIDYTVFGVIKKTSKGAKMNVAEEIRSRRNVLGLNLTQMSLQIGISKQHLHLIESGHCTRGKKILTVLKFFEINPSDIEKAQRKIKAYKPKGYLLADFLTKQRVRLGITQKKMSQEVGITPSFYSFLENARITNVDKTLLDKIEKIIGSKIPKEFLEGEVRIPKPRALVLARTPIGEFVFCKRKELGLTRAELVKRARLSKTKIHQIEMRNHKLRSITIRKLSDALGCDIPKELVSW